MTFGKPILIQGGHVSIIYEIPYVVESYYKMEQSKELEYSNKISIIAQRMCSLLEASIIQPEFTELVDRSLRTVAEMLMDELDKIEAEIKKQKEDTGEDD